ncbi:nitroreductase family protein [Streptomyces somaliensis DSM 40738]|uniref:Dehydrogenase n=1 Tax=Streptomyces somaliensis (strain ATCC 33201 / DSM 40738 / JCM 12659 / KCTC 9044 / NCTC 11332 / NRRL B-12077 / IP 733) TaxID=1134445 RepID=A0AA44DG01_STRE0|nr:nitroreductase family protein [Streptomyces somaliensis]MCQ0025026.1 nitroreductase family protein [Streptomyces somaliensis DSM 40738]NKY15431.1 dehydrogenase [Streptomyces somaliensis DSM 40738]
MTTATADHATVSRIIRTRRSVRHYRPEPVPARLVHELTDLALEAPSSFNLQARSIVVVSGEEGRRALTRATGGQPQPREAPVVLVFVAESTAWREDRGDIRETARSRGAWSQEFADATPEAVRLFHEDLSARGLEREYAVKDAVIAASFLMVAAEAMGLATSPMGGWDEEEVKKAIGAGGRDDVHIALLMPLGYPAERRLHPGRRDRALTCFSEAYGR